MIDQIQLEMEKAIRPPMLSLDTLFVSDVDTEVQKCFNTKQCIKLSKEELTNIIDKYGRITCDFIDKFTDVEDIQFGSISDGYMISEYFGKSDIYIPSPEYFKYIKDINNDFIMSVYNGTLSNIVIPEIRDKFQSVSNVAGYQFPRPQSIKYSKFNNTKYHENVRIGKYMYDFPILSVNIPYEYYSKQDIPENIYTWDIDKGTYSFAGKNTEEFIEFFNKICTDGIRHRMFMQISNGKIISADNESYLIMLIAKYLKLPSIPVNLYMLNNDESNMLFSNRQIDIINKKNGTSIGTDKEYDIINSITEPYFIFAKDNYDKLDTSKYVPNRDIRSRSMSSFKAVDFYQGNIDKNYNECNDEISDEETAKLHEKLRMEVNKRISDDIEQYLNTL